MDMPEYDTLQKLKRFVLKYTKVLLNQKRESRGLHLVEDDERHEDQRPEQQEVEQLAALAEAMNLEAFDPEQQNEILAFVAGKFQFRPRGAAGGGAGRFPSRPPAAPAARFGQGGGGFRSAGVAPRLPPRNKSDMSCVNCSIKGHMAADCKKPRAEQGQRPCFICQKLGHPARDCPDKKAHIKSVTQAPLSGQPQPAFLG